MIYFIQNQNDQQFILKSVNLSQKSNSENNFYTNEDVEIIFEYEVLKDILGLRIGFDLLDTSSGSVIFRSFHDDDNNQMELISKGDYKLITHIPSNFLKNGSYGIKLSIGIHNKRWIVHSDKLIIQFSANNIDGLNRAFSDSRPGLILPKLIWTAKKNND